MKIQKLHIDSFRHLENVEFDFTYQTGERKGQPLDKICLIGQSATGKTSVLEFIKTAIEKYQWSSNGGYIEFIHNHNVLNNKLENIQLFENSVNEINRTVLYYFTSEILAPHTFSVFTEDINRQIQLKEFGGGYNHFNDKDFKSLIHKRIIEIGNVQNNNTVVYYYVINGIIKFREELLQKISTLFSNSNSIEKEMIEWKNNNPNPLVELAKKCLNPILQKVNLEVDLIDTSVPIPLKAINNDKAIPANALSTGTKQLLLTAVPLFKLPTDDTMILIDEPERSLYPDMQIELMDYYKNLAPNAQFIVATHSPFIAAAFEPEERFILYFGEDGKVKVRNGVSPIGDDPNDILYNDFGLSSVINKAGEEAYKIYLEKKQQMIFEEDKAKKKELLKEVEEIGEKYNF